MGDTRTTLSDTTNVAAPIIGAALGFATGGPAGAAAGAAYGAKAGSILAGDPSGQGFLGRSAQTSQNAGNLAGALGGKKAGVAGAGRAGFGVMAESGKKNFLPGSVLASQNRKGQQGSRMSGEHSNADSALKASLGSSLLDVLSRGITGSGNEEEDDASLLVRLGYLKSLIAPMTPTRR